MKSLVLCFTTLLLLAQFCFADPDKIVIGGLNGIDPRESSERNEILLALSGGGARGLASIGIIKAFEEKNINIIALAGTSMGGIVGGLYAAGYSPGELSTIVNDIDFNDFFVDAPGRQTMLFTRRQEFERHLISIRFDNFKPVIPQGWTGGQKITAVLNRLTTKANYRCGGDFNKLEIPFKTVATDVVSGNEVIIDKGSMSEAMRATMAFPLALTAVESNGYILMDGGMVTPVPAAIARNMLDGNHLLVAVNTASKLVPKEELRTPVDIAGQVTTIMTRDKMVEQLSKADFVIEPPLGNLESADFKYKDSIIEIGYRAGLKAADSILLLSRENLKTSKLKLTKVNVSGGSKNLQNAIKGSMEGNNITKSALVERLKTIVITDQLFQLDASITTFDEKSGIENVELDISIENSIEVSKYRFRFVGNSLMDSSLLANLLVVDVKQMTSIELKEGIARIERKYSDDGYDVAFISDVIIDRVNKEIFIKIDEAIVQGIDVDDNSRTQDWLVRSYFPIRVGEPYSTHRAAAGLANLYGTDLFEQIMAELVPVEGGARVKIRVKERYYAQLRIGWHWDDDYKSEQFVEFLDDNIRGMGLEYLLHAQYAEDRQKYFAQLKLDRIWFSYITARITGYHNRVNKSIYDSEGKEIDIRKERRTGFEISLGQQVKRFGTVRGAFVLEKVRNRFMNSPTQEDFNQRLFHFESVIETFDKHPFPDKGTKIHSEIRFAGEFFGGELEYRRFYFTWEGFIPLGQYVNFHPRFSLGLSGSDLPVSEQFFIGGAGLFSGYRAFEYSGDKLILVNNEVRFKLPLSLYLIGRYDFGEVYAHTDQIKLRNLRHGWGAFLAFNSPIGPFEFGYGVADSDNDRFYVNIGLNF